MMIISLLKFTVVIVVTTTVIRLEYRDGCGVDAVTTTTTANRLDPIQQVNKSSNRSINTWKNYVRTSTSITTNHSQVPITSKALQNDDNDISSLQKREVLETTTDDNDIINPYTSGCLYTKEKVSQIRVCNSEDSIDIINSGIYCRIPDVDYMEIRIFSDNWESITYEAWILQILLSELLDVPTTIETGTDDGLLNFYHPDAPMIYGAPGSNDALQLAYEIGDCRFTTKTTSNTYRPCAHIDSERWTGIQYSSPLRDLVHEGIVEPPQSLGTLGLESLFITKFSVVTDPTLISYLGLMGEENRNKLAETFLRPTTWQDYCETVSINNCTTPDNVAQRGPETVEENEQFYSESNYIGYFRATDDNNCTVNPNSCTGHVADFPCGWNSYLLPQIHYLNMALKSTGSDGPGGGYPYERLVEMWKAANATKSNLMMQFFAPEPLYQEFLGTDAEFIKVTLPTRTQECLNSRRPLDDMCSEDEAIRIGESEGICEESAKPLWKVIVGNLYDQINDPSIPIPIRSPAYDVLQVFQISELQLGQIFDYRRIEATPRDAVCRWVSENLDYLQTIIPRDFPRTINDDINNSKNGGTSNEPIVYIATVVGGITTVVVIITWLMVYHRRTVHAMRMAQIEFLYLLLAGSLLIGFGAIIVGLPPTTATCVTAIWFINLGYTLELVPLIVKVAAVNKLMGAARQFRRIVLTRRSLFGAVFGISTLVLIFLLLWTIMDVPHKNREYSLTNDIMTDSLGNNRTVVDVVYYCSSDSLVWDFIAVGWNGLLLLCATVLAVQTRTVQKDFNESQTLAFLIYSHFSFVLLRLIILLLSSGSSSTVNEATLSGLRSLIFSIDTLATIIIYFVPKFLAADPNRSSMMLSWNGLSNSNLVSGPGSSSNNTMNTFQQQLNRRQSSKPFQSNNPKPEMTVTDHDVTETSMNHMSQTSIVLPSTSSLNICNSEVIQEAVEDEMEEQETDLVEPVTAADLDVYDDMNQNNDSTTSTTPDNNHKEEAYADI